MHLILTILDSLLLANWLCGMKYDKNVFLIMAYRYINMNLIVVMIYKLKRSAIEPIVCQVLLFIYFLFNLFFISSISMDYIFLMRGYWKALLLGDLCSSMLFLLLSEFNGYFLFPLWLILLGTEWK